MDTVVQVVQHMRPGGIETMALDLVNFCEKHEKSLIISLEGDRESAVQYWPRLKPVSDKLIFLKKKPGLNPSLIYQLSRLLKGMKANVVHTHHIGPLLYAGIASRLSGVKHLIHTEHDAWHLSNPRRCRLQRWTIRLTRPQLIADADSVAISVKKQLRLNKTINVIHNGIDTERFIPGNQSNARQYFGLPQNVQLVGCSGRLEKVKGQKNLILSLSQLPDTVHLALAGEGSLEIELRQLVKSLKLDNRVHFLGRIDEMPTFYQALDIFCLPSLNEGLPLSPLEAQSCGITSAVTDVGGSAEALCPDSGRLIPADNISAMSSVIHKTLKHPGKIDPRCFVQQHRDVRLMARSYTAIRQKGG